MTITELHEQARSTGQPTPGAVQLTSVSKVYGSGHNSVAALRELTLALPTGILHRGDGSVGVRARAPFSTAPPASTVRPQARSSSATSTSTAWTKNGLSRFRRERIGFVFQSFNLVPSLTAATEHHAAAAAGQAEARRGLARGSDRSRRPGRSDQAQARRALRRPAAACGDRPRTGHATRSDLRRRADRGARHPNRQGDPRAAARSRRRPRRKPS